MEDEIFQSDFLIEVNSIEKSTSFKISPIGEVKGADGRIFAIDGAKVINNTKNRVIDIVLNKEHQSGEAMGWFDINSLELKDDGIYAKAEFNNLGDEAIKNRHFRYLSPEFLLGKNREVNAIIGVGLVNAPNLLNKAINNQEKEENMPEIDELKKEVNSFKQKNEDLSKEVNSLQEENKALKEANKLSIVDNAIAKGELLPAQKDFALSLEANSLAGYLASVKEVNTQITSNLAKETGVKNDEEKEDNNQKILESMGW